MTQVWARSAPSPLVELRRPLGRPRSVTADLGPAFCAADGLRRFASALPALPDGRSRRRTRRRPHRATGAVWCIGMNYAAHAAESGSAPPRWPVLFLKTPNTVVGPYDDVPVPRGSGKTDWEVELGVVSVGPRAISPLRRRRAPASPVTSRPTTSPSVLSSWRGVLRPVEQGQVLCRLHSGVAVVRHRGRADSGSLRLRSWVNGEPRQDSSTRHDLRRRDHRLRSRPVRRSRLGRLDPHRVPRGVACRAVSPTLPSATSSRSTSRASALPASA